MSQGNGSIQINGEGYTYGVTKECCEMTQDVSGDLVWTQTVEWQYSTSRLYVAYNVSEDTGGIGLSIATKGEKYEKGPWSQVGIKIEARPQELVTESILQTIAPFTTPVLYEDMVKILTNPEFMLEVVEECKEWVRENRVPIGVVATTGAVIGLAMIAGPAIIAAIGTSIT